MQHLSYGINLPTVLVLHMSNSILLYPHVLILVLLSAYFVVSCPSILS